MSDTFHHYHAFKMLSGKKNGIAKSEECSTDLRPVVPGCARKLQPLPGTKATEEDRREAKEVGP